MKDKEKDIIASLLANKDFRDWVFNPLENRNLYWKKWMETHPEHKEAIEKARNTILKLKFKEHHLEDNELEEILGNVVSGKRSPRNVRAITFRQSNLTWWLKIAASVLILAFTVYFFRYMLNEFVENSSVQHVVEIKKAFNPEGQKSKIQLPDGTFVNLNAGSTLLFPEAFSDTLRVVELRGEAFFDVVKNESKPFIVKTNNIETEVLGTTFNVRAFEGDHEINVALVSGKVSVTGKGELQDDQNHILFPGEKLTYNKSESSYVKSHFDLTEETGWKDEILVFDNTGFREVVKLLERWYGVKINVVNAPDKKWNVNGHFKNETLEEVLIGIQFTYEIDYKIENKMVTLNCK